MYIGDIKKEIEIDTIRQKKNSRYKKTLPM